MNSLREAGVEKLVLEAGLKEGGSTDHHKKLTLHGPARLRKITPSRKVIISTFEGGCCSGDIAFWKKYFPQRRRKKDGPLSPSVTRRLMKKNPKKKTNTRKGKTGPGDRKSGIVVKKGDSLKKGSAEDGGMTGS